MVQSKVYTLTEPYFRKIKNGRLKKYDIVLTELICHKCRIPISIGEKVATKQIHSRIKRTYYHPSCARILHIL